MAFVFVALRKRRFTQINLRTRKIDLNDQKLRPKIYELFSCYPICHNSELVKKYEDTFSRRIERQAHHQQACDLKLWIGSGIAHNPVRNYSFGINETLFSVLSSLGEFTLHYMSSANFGFSPLETSIGALLIQFGTTLYLVQIGKTVGFSSLVGNFKFNIDNSSLIIGLYLSYQFVRTLIPEFLPIYGSSVSSSTYVTAGLLVGVGSNLASGCTSGHMLAGLSRMRLRSLVATALFFFGGVLSASLTTVKNRCRNRMGEGINCYQYDLTFETFNRNKDILRPLVLSGLVLTYFLLPFLSIFARKYTLYCIILRVVSGIVTGFYFGAGLFISGMASSDKVLGFLRIWDPANFDPSLALIVMFAVVPNIFIWKYIFKQPKYPTLADKWDLANSNDISRSLIIGSLTFGLGWGIIGVCPGPGLLSFFVGKREWLVGFLVGFQTTRFLKPYFVDKSS